MLRTVLEILAQALHDEGYLDLQEAFIDGSFAPATRGGACVGKTKRGKGSKIMAIADQDASRRSIPRCTCYRSERGRHRPLPLRDCFGSISAPVQLPHPDDSVAPFAMRADYASSL